MVRAQIVFLVLILLSGCSQRTHIVVGSKNFTEQVLLGEIIAQHIERRLGIQVDRKLNLGGTLLAHEAMKSGAIDLYPLPAGVVVVADCPLQFFLWGNDVVIVDSCSREVVDIVPNIG